jgi:hypothetical protein
VSIPANAATLGAAGYGVNPLVVPVNTTVTWVNNDTVNHTVTATDGSFDSGTLAPGQSFSMTFVADGYYTYSSTIDGTNAMSGAVQVGNAASPTPSASPATTASPAATASPSATPTIGGTAGAAGSNVG